MNHEQLQFPGAPHNRFAECSDAAIAVASVSRFQPAEPAGVAGYSIGRAAHDIAAECADAATAVVAIGQLRTAGPAGVARHTLGAPAVDRTARRPDATTAVAAVGQLQSSGAAGSSGLPIGLIVMALSKSKLTKNLQDALMKGLEDPTDDQKEGIRKVAANLAEAIHGYVLDAEVAGVQVETNVQGSGKLTGSQKGTVKVK